MSRNSAFGVCFCLACIVVASLAFAIEWIPNEIGFSVGAMALHPPAFPTVGLYSLHAEFYGPSYVEALDYLTDRGFYLDSQVQWHVPHDFEVCAKDLRAVAFLSIEWGYSAGFIRDAEVFPPLHRQH